MRSKATFIRLIDKELRASPEQPVRFDAEPGEYKTLSAIAEARGWESWQVEHIVPHMREQGLSRVALLTPETRKPAPIKRIPIKDYSKREQLRDKLQKSYGDQFFIDVDFAGFEGECKPGIYCMVWTAQDWMELNLLPFSHIEILHSTRLNIRTIRRLKPVAAKGRKMVNAQSQRREIWQQQRREEWAAWQEWIDDAVTKRKCTFEFAQRKAAERFKVSLKSIKRRTQNTRTS